jgi:hypothetical protein
VAGHCLLLASLYLGGGVIGLAYMLYVFTRPEATRTGIPAATVHRLAGLLFALILIRAGISLVLFLLASPLLSEARFPITTGGLLALFLAVIALPFLGLVALRQSRSPRPSTSAPSLIALCLVGFLAENLARLLAG